MTLILNLGAITDTFQFTIYKEPLSRIMSWNLVALNLIFLMHIRVLRLPSFCFFLVMAPDMNTTIKLTLAWDCFYVRSWVIDFTENLIVLKWIFLLLLFLASSFISNYLLIFPHWYKFLVALHWLVARS